VLALPRHLRGRGGRRPGRGLLGTVGCPGHGEPQAARVQRGQRNASGSPERRRRAGVHLADDPLSALDVSIQAQILNLLMRLQDGGRPHLPVHHPRFEVAATSANGWRSLYLGSIVEVAPTASIFAEALHPIPGPFWRGAQLGKGATPPTTGRCGAISQRHGVAPAVATSTPAARWVDAAEPRSPPCAAPATALAACHLVPEHRGSGGGAPKARGTSPGNTNPCTNPCSRALRRRHGAPGPLGDRPAPSQLRWLSGSLRAPRRRPRRSTGCRRREMPGASCAPSTRWMWRNACGEEWASWWHAPRSDRRRP